MCVCFVCCVFRVLCVRCVKAVCCECKACELALRCRCAPPPAARPAARACASTPHWDPSRRGLRRRQLAANSSTFAACRYACACSGALRRARRAAAARTCSSAMCLYRLYAGPHSDASQSWSWPQQPWEGGIIAPAITDHSSEGRAACDRERGLQVCMRLLWNGESTLAACRLASATPTASPAAGECVLVPCSPRPRPCTQRLFAFSYTFSTVVSNQIRLWRAQQWVGVQPWSAMRWGRLGATFSSSGTRSRRGCSGALAPPAGYQSSRPSMSLNSCDQGLSCASTTRKAI